MILFSGPRRLVALHSTDDVAAAALPVRSTPSTYRTLLRLVVPAGAGDLLDIDARARITNNTGYTVGVAYHLWLYDVDASEPRPWRRVGPSSGDNVMAQRHHLPVHISAVYQVPEHWPSSHRPVVVLRADAHSTAAESGDALVVDPLGVLTVRRWAVPPDSEGSLSGQ